MINSLNTFINNIISNSLNKECSSLLPIYDNKISFSFSEENLEEKEEDIKLKDILFETQNNNNDEGIIISHYNSFDLLNLNTENIENIEQDIYFKNDPIDKLSTNSNFINEFTKQIDFINKEFQVKNTNTHKKYRKDGYYKHFKVIFGKYLKNKGNKLKNICFPEYSNNNFSTPNYKYIGNPKEKDNYNFLSYKVKDILVYGKDKNKHNRQYNNEILINYIEKNQNKSKDKIAYEKLIVFLNISLEEAFINFYNDKNQFEKINKDKICVFSDVYFKKETGISLLEKNGFLIAMKRKIKN